MDWVFYLGAGLFAGAYPVLLYGMWLGAVSEPAPGRARWLAPWPLPVTVGIAMWLASWPVLIAHHVLCP